MRYVEQDGNIFKEVSKGKFEYVPRKVEQDGNIFQFNLKTKDYDFVGTAQPVKMEATPSPEATVIHSDAYRAARVAFEKAGSAYTRPTVAGVGAAVGGFTGALQSGSKLLDAIKTGKESFQQARDEAILEQEELAKKYPIPSGVAEIAGNIATAPLMAAKGLAGALKVGAATGVGQAVGEATTSEEAMSKIGQNLVAGAVTHGLFKGAEATYEKAKDTIKVLIPEKFLAKVASTTSGIPQKDIETYAKNVDEINGMIKEFGGDTALASDEVKIRLKNAIAKARTELGEGIGTTLKELPDDKVFPTKPIIEKLNEVKGQLNQFTKEAERAQIDEFINMVKKVAGNKKNISIQDVNVIKQYLQDSSSKSFVKNGAIFPPDRDVARAARAGYFQAKSILDDVSPVIKEANQQLHQMHVLEESMNKNLIAAGKPEASLLAAGAAENSRNANVLKQLGELTGTEPLKEAQKVSAMRSFADTQLLPQGERTGYVAARILGGAGLGAGIAEISGGDWKTGGLIGAAATGPSALKAFINATNISGKAINKAVQQLENPNVRSVVIRELGTAGSAGQDKLESMKKRLELLKNRR